jgi:hypothetical protein
MLDDPEAPEQDRGAEHQERRWAGVVVGFCLVSLMVSLVWLTFVGQPRTAGATRREKCNENLTEVARSCLLWMREHRGSPPQSLQTLAGAASRYPLKARRLHCPESKQAYVMVPPSPRPDPRGVLLYETPDGHRETSGAHVAYADGRVVWLTTRQLDAELKSTRSRHPSGAGFVP